MTEVLIAAEHVSKKFCRDLKKSLWYAVKDSANDLLRIDPHTDLRSGEFWANKDISFELCRGECLGLIGRNGSGKTTLLKMLSGLIKPDEGRIAIRGRVAAMIALGAGFNPLLTGRENIAVNSSILGLSKTQLNESFHEIVEFAELDEFIDSPVQNYSSGMKVRLGFAVAVVLLKPDVLLLDEVLAVGDSKFRAKCLNRVIAMLEDSAVIFVSHSEQQVKRICTKALFLERGKNRLLTEDVFTAFQHYNHSAESSLETGKNQWTQLAGELVKEPFIPDSLTAGTPILASKEIRLGLTIRARANLQGMLVRLVAKSSEGQRVAAYQAEHELPLCEGEVAQVEFSIDGTRLATGTYEFAISISESYSQKIILRNTRWFHCTVVSGSVHDAMVELPAQVAILKPETLT